MSRRERDREQKIEANLTHTHDEEPAMLMLECDKDRKGELLLNEGEVKLQLNQGSDKREESNVWYLDNGESSHMTGFRAKF